MAAWSELCLASASPRRGELLERLGVTYHRVVANIDESPYPNEPPAQYVERLAREKALAVIATQHHHNVPVLAADTIVTIDGKLLGKPVNAQDATAMLQRLSGRTHEVYTAVAIAASLNSQLKIDTRISQNYVTFCTLTPQLIRAYVDSGDPFDKAGAYGIQSIAEAFVTDIRGSFSGIMGLPLYETRTLLETFSIPFTLSPRSSCL